jgi:RNA polymerase sigma-70 factor, ECF subfamily
MAVIVVEQRTRQGASVVGDRTDHRVSNLIGQRGEQRLVRRAQAGSRAAAAELFELHWPAAHRAALAVTGRHAMADDVTQDAFERAFARIANFDTERPFAPWLHRIVVNRAIDVLRQERRLIDIDNTPDELLAVWDGDGSGDREALAALAHLTHDRRAVVVMRHLLGYHPPEIAEMLGIPLGTVNSRLGRALADLREHLEARG